MMIYQNIENVLQAYERCMSWMHNITGTSNYHSAEHKAKMKRNNVLFDELLDVVYANIPRPSDGVNCVKATDEERAECQRILDMGVERFGLIFKIPPVVLEECLPILVVSNVLRSGRGINRRESRTFHEFYLEYGKMVLND